MGWSNEMVSSMFTLSKHRKQERREQSSRSVVQCWVFGEEGSGKTSFLRALVGPWEMQNSERNGKDDKKEEYVAAEMVTLTQTQKTLMLMEVSPEKARSLIAKAEEMSVPSPFEQMDVAVFLYAANDRRSFVEARNLMLKVSEAGGDYLPCLLLCTKSDLPPAQGLEDDVRELCAELKMKTPVRISVEKGELNDVYRTLVQTAIKPTIDSIPETPARKSQRMRRLWTKRLLIAGGAASAIILFSVYVYPRWRTKEPHDAGAEMRMARR